MMKWTRASASWNGFSMLPFSPIRAARLLRSLEQTKLRNKNHPQCSAWLYFIMCWCKQMTQLAWVVLALVTCCSGFNDDLAMSKWSPESLYRSVYRPRGDSLGETRSYHSRFDTPKSIYYSAVRVRMVLVEQIVLYCKLLSEQHTFIRIIFTIGTFQLPTDWYCW